MKKFVLLLSIITMACSCKQQDRKNNAADDVTGQVEIMESKDSIICNSYDIINQMNNLPDDEDLAAWLNQNGAAICEQGLYECIPQYHKIDKIKYWNMVTAHPENRYIIKKYTVKWKDVAPSLASIDCYQKYLAFNFSSSGIRFKITDFTTHESCYSKAFLLGVKSLHHIDDNDSLVFNRARDSSGKDKVLFRAGSKHDVYYDISDNPKKR